MAGQVRKDTIQLEVIINGQKAGDTQKQIRANIRDMNRELDKLTVGTDAYNKKVGEIARETVKLNAHKKAIRDQVSELENGGKKVNVFTDSLKKGAVAALAFFSVQRVIEWGKQVVSWAIKGSAALESQQRKTAIVFGDAIDIVEDYAALNAQALGVTETAYASLAAQIGDILIPMGFQREEAAQLSADLTNLSGALSEWTNGQRSAEDVSKILAKALTGERESLKELGIVITEADISQRLLIKGQKELTGSALQQAKAMANYELILEKSKDAQASYALNTDSTTRGISRFTAALNIQKENILKAILPAVNALANKWADAAAPVNKLSNRLREQQRQFNTYIRVLDEGRLSEQGQQEILTKLNTTYKLTGEATLTLTNYRAKLRDVER
jgi:chromosome segregation ATPase